jgi:hypothetical protein
MASRVSNIFRGAFCKIYQTHRFRFTVAGFFRGLCAKLPVHPLPLACHGRRTGRAGRRRRRRLERPRVRPRWGKGRGDRGGSGELLTTGGEGRQDGRRRTSAVAGGGAKWWRCSGGISATGSGGASSARRCDARGGVDFTRRSSVAANRGGGRCRLQAPAAALHKAASGPAARAQDPGGGRVLGRTRGGGLGFARGGSASPLWGHERACQGRRRPWPVRPLVGRWA